MKNDGSAQMVLVLTIKEIRYVVLDLFDNLVWPFSYNIFVTLSFWLRCIF